ncbi:MAG: hypothetical protein IT482_06520 [Gammaproteobacteria bacterium]|jgi:hypothetical protein|nr:hypothetical protein [Gammaproteobacteria bacterium]
MTTQWGWPIAECFHFIGLCLLFGTVGFFDLRMLGVARAVPLRSLHRLIPFGIAGFAICAITGTLFVMTTPDQYLHNPAFLTKLLLMLVAGLNMLLFYLVAARSVWLAAADGVPPLPARLFGLVSLLCWLGVMTCGRVITAYRPPAFYWCPWC